MPEKQTITSLAGVASPLLATNPSNPDMLVDSSLWLPREWPKTTPYLIDEVKMDPGYTNLAVELAWEIPKQATLIQDIILQCQAPPVAVLPVGAPAQYTDFTGFAMIDFFRIHFGSNMVYDRRKEDLYLKYIHGPSFEEQNSFDQDVGGNQTIAQLTTDLLNGRTYRIPLWLPGVSDHRLPEQSWPLVDLSQKTRLTMQAQPLANFTQSTIFNPATVLTPSDVYRFKLLLTQIYTTGPESDAILSLSRKPDGISYMIHQNIRQIQDIVANQTTAYESSTVLGNFNRPLRSFYWSLIPTRLRNNTGYNDFFMYAPNPLPVPPGMNPYAPIQFYRIEASGQLIQRPVDEAYIRITKHRENFPKCFSGAYIYKQIYTWCENYDNEARGYLDWNNLNNPTLFVTFGVGGTGVDPIIGGAQQLTFVFNALDYNFWFIKGGNWSRAFN